MTTEIWTGPGSSLVHKAAAKVAQWGSLDAEVALLVVIAGGGLAVCLAGLLVLERWERRGGKRRCE